MHDPDVTLPFFTLYLEPQDEPDTTSAAGCPSPAESLSFGRCVLDTKKYPSDDDELPIRY
ncbi:MAG TPA: microviridin/marinostatin family tricyclic proteinase inhibitor [Myxococcota bacterium]|nr:microviridin/marinostatin family tricyclic proteinase inhibitor [Myxococcota bacterium]